MGAVPSCGGAMKDAVNAAGAVVGGVQTIIDRGPTAIIAACLLGLIIIASVNFFALRRIEDSFIAHRESMQKTLITLASKDADFFSVLGTIRENTAKNLQSNADMLAAFSAYAVEEARTDGERKAWSVRIQDSMRTLHERLNLVVITGRSVAPMQSGEGAQ